jgi:hypothetical protein
MGCNSVRCPAVYQRHARKKLPATTLTASRAELPQNGAALHDGVTASEQSVIALNKTAVMRSRFIRDTRHVRVEWRGVLVLIVGSMIHTAMACSAFPGQFAAVCPRIEGGHLICVHRTGSFEAQ